MNLPKEETFGLKENPNLIFARDFGSKRITIVTNTLLYLLPRDVIPLITSYDFNFILQVQHLKESGSLCFYADRIWIAQNRFDFSSRGWYIHLYQPFSKREEYIPSFENNCIVHDGWIRTNRPFKVSGFDAYGDSYEDQIFCWVINGNEIPLPIGSEIMSIMFKRNDIVYTAYQQILYWKEFLTPAPWKSLLLKEGHFPFWYQWSVFKENILVILTPTKVYEKEISTYPFQLNFYQIVFSAATLVPIYSICFGQMIDRENWTHYTLMTTQDKIHVLLLTRTQPIYFEFVFDLL